MAGISKVLCISVPEYFLMTAKKVDPAPYGISSGSSLFVKLPVKGVSSYTCLDNATCSTRSKSNESKKITDSCILEN